MKVSLTPDLESYVKNMVEFGSYNSESEVIQEGLKALQEKEIDAKIQIGLKQAEADLSVPFDANFAEDLKREVRERIAARKKQE